MFLTAKEVEESLERQETATCLAWCHDNKSRLRKMKVAAFQTMKRFMYRDQRDGPFCCYPAASSDFCGVNLTGFLSDSLAELSGV